MLIFHIAEASRWEAAQLAGSYAQSTLGRSLEDEGFIHAAREDQVDDVRRRYYAGVTEPLVLLTIDTDRLTSPWQEDVVGDVTFPHVYGPLNPGAVVATRRLDDPGPAAEPVEGTSERAPNRTFLELFLAEMTFRMFLAVAVMAFAAACFALGNALSGDSGAAVGVLLGLALGIGGAVVVARRREGRLSPG